MADRIALSVADPAGNVTHQHVVLDGDGRIIAILDHPDAASAEADLAPAAAGAAAVVADALVPFVQVADVEASIVFYALLGFEVVREHRSADRRVWAWLRGRRIDDPDGYCLMVAERD